MYTGSINVFTITHNFIGDDLGITELKADQDNERDRMFCLYDQYN